MGFVSSLKRGYLKQQFGLFCWVHMTLLLIVVSRWTIFVSSCYGSLTDCVLHRSHFIVNNILEGLIWFWVPASLVICNDVFAYIWGITIGRTPLIALSPKKTVEGFVGAFFSTVVFSLVWGTYFMRFDYMICPVRDLGVSAWTSVTCDPNPVFLWHSAQLPAALSVPLSTMVSPVSTADCLKFAQPFTVVVARPLSDVVPIPAVPVPLAGHVLLCLAGGAVRRLLRLRLQARVSHQGLWS